MEPEIRWWEKLIVRFGSAIVRVPPERFQKKLPEDHVLALHYCEKCGSYRFDRIFDPLSQSELMRCGSCGTKTGTGRWIGLIPFYLIECRNIASNAGKNTAQKAFMFFRFLLFGINKKYLPPSREGRTIGELDAEAASQILQLFLLSIGIK